MLTTNQLTTLAANIAADPVLQLLPHDSPSAQIVAAAYNLLALGPVIVWRTSLSTTECKTATTWTEYISRSQGERDAWRFMLEGGSINPADANIRQGIQDIFSGGGGALSRAALTAASKRSATRAEALFKTGTGSDASPATMTFEGELSYQDVMLAWGI